MKTIIITLFLIASDFVSASAPSVEKIQVTQRMPELEERVVTVISERTAGTTPIAPPSWKMKDTKFKAIAKDFEALPDSKDTLTTCPQNYLKIEYTAEGKTKTKFSCFMKTNEVRRKYIRFAGKIL